MRGKDKSALSANHQTKPQKNCNRSVDHTLVRVAIVDLQGEILSQPTSSKTCRNTVIAAKLAICDVVEMWLVWF